MEINEKSIRIRSFNEKDLAWHKYIDWEKQDLTVPCFFNGTDSMVYSEFLRPSLDLLHFRKLCKIREKETGEKYIVQKRDEEYTDVFIVVTMDNNKSIFRIPEEKREVLHEYLYCYGIYQLDDWDKYVRYIEYKRSGNAAKKGKHIFIREDFYDEMMSWSWMGWNPKELEVRMPYVEMKAYESLVNSTIKSAVRIDPEEILLLDDIKHLFRTKISKIEQNPCNSMELDINRCEDDVENNLFDGECLIDESVFKEEKIDAGMMLLRNFFFKSCGFRTDIQGYYKQIWGEQYEKAKIEDCFGNKLEVKKIKMIVTKSSFKLFKFRKYFGSLYGTAPGADWDFRRSDWPTKERMEELDDLDDKTMEYLAYKKWRSTLWSNDCIFGVVKNEEVHHDKRNFTYQMINSMNFSKDDIDELLEGDIKKLVDLRTDYNVYEAYIGNGESTSYTNAFILELAKKNPVFRQTIMYKEKRNNDIRAFKQKLYEGKIKVDADYYTLCSMPWELLQYSVNRTDEFDSILKPGEIYIQGVADNEQRTLCRNPHVCASNVVCATNRKKSQLDQWFHFTHSNGHCNIVVISPWEWDVMEALNGADFDSDEVLCIRNKTVLKRALELQQNDQIAAVPHIQLSTNDKKTMETQDFVQQYVADSALRGNKIGLISNYAQILNGYYWDSFHEGSRFRERQKELYDDILILAGLIGVEIDKAKHTYSLDAAKAAKKIMKKYAVTDSDGKKHLDRPVFMCFINKERHGEAAKKAKENQWLDCPMDYLAKRIYLIWQTEEALINLKPTPTIALENLFDVEQSKGYNTVQVKTVLSKLNTCVKGLKELNINKANLEWTENEDIKKSLLNETYRVLNKNDINVKEMKKILSTVLETDVTEKMQRKKIRKFFYQCLLEKNEETICEIVGTTELADVSEETIREAATAYLKQAKNSGAKKQINYVKCRKIFEQFIEAKDTKERTESFRSGLKTDKNKLNIAYMLQVITPEEDFGAAKREKLITLSILYHEWQELFLSCVKTQM